jgi:hypothetical protein
MHLVWDFIGGLKGWVLIHMTIKLTQCLAPWRALGENKLSSNPLRSSAGSKNSMIRQMNQRIAYRFY